MASYGWNYMERMDTYKYPDNATNQPGLEVGDDPYRSPHTGWPDQTHPVWGVQLKTEQSGCIPVEKLNAGSIGSGNPPAMTKRILGLSVGVFWALVVLLCCILAAGIGGGVGVGLASTRNLCPSSNRTSSGASTSAQSTQTSSASTATMSQAPSSSPAPTSQCSTRSDFNGTVLTPHDPTGNPISLANDPQSFAVLCNTDFPSGASSNRHDIMKISAVDPLHCVNSCAEYNAGLEKLIFNGIIGADGGSIGFCRAISLVLEEGEFCYLKNGTGVGGQDTSSGNRQVASAVLISKSP